MRITVTRSKAIGSILLAAVSSVRTTARTLEHCAAMCLCSVLISYCRFLPARVSGRSCAGLAETAGRDSRHGIVIGTQALILLRAFHRQR
ncbi:hypothetical protein HOY82DRAFT_83160 [Tuber indicum]|nr:hypothetical protein HOY82DRAFT_83160 [Tuber indicum]